MQTDLLCHLGMGFHDAMSLETWSHATSPIQAALRSSGDCPTIANGSNIEVLRPFFLQKDLVQFENCLRMTHKYQLNCICSTAYHTITTRILNLTKVSSFVFITIIEWENSG